MNGDNIPKEVTTEPKIEWQNPVSILKFINGKLKVIYGIGICASTRTKLTCDKYVIKHQYLRDHFDVIANPNKPYIRIGWADEPEVIN
jgi:hypothetical protein